MQKFNFKKTCFGVAIFLRHIAQNPYKAFLPLLLVALAISAYIFFNVGKADYLNNLQNAVVKKELFNSVKANDYRVVFGIINQRQKNYDQIASSTYPAVFGHH